MRFFMGAYSVSSSWMPGGGGGCSNSEDEADDDEEDFRLSLSSSVMKSGCSAPPLLRRGELRGMVRLMTTPLLMVPRLRWPAGLEEDPAAAVARERLPVENGAADARCVLPIWAVLKARR